MHQAIFAAYRRLIAPLDFTGSALEIGAIPSDKSLLAMPELKRSSERVGVNLDGPHSYGGFDIVKGNANALPFDSDSFDMVLCNAMIEHDPRFWLTISEIRRVTRPGGIVVIGAPGYRESGFARFQNSLARLAGPFSRNATLNPLFTATLTFRVHDAPGDYYRFSPQAFREVILEGMTDKIVTSVMAPPRLIGIGRKPT